LFWYLQRDFLSLIREFSGGKLKPKGFFHSVSADVFWLISDLVWIREQMGHVFIEDNDFLFCSLSFYAIVAPLSLHPPHILPNANLLTLHLPTDAEFFNVMGTKVLRGFLLSLQFTVTSTKGFYPLSFLSKSGLKLVCNVNIVYGNSQGYAQEPQGNCTFMNSASVYKQVIQDRLTGWTGL
jgi:hypothetical protein